MLAIGLALIASFCFAAAMIFINRGVLVLDYFRGLLTNLGINALFLLIYLFSVGNRHALSDPANLIFVLVGVLVPGVARFFIFRGIKRKDVSWTAYLTNSTPLFANVLEVFFLRGRPSATNLLGTFAIVCGIVALSWKGSTKSWRT